MATTQINVLGITMALWTAAALTQTISAMETTCHPNSTTMEFASRFNQKSIMSPGYPYGFPIINNCSWLIQNNLSNGAGYIIEVVINLISLHRIETSLSFYDGVSPTKSRLLRTFRRYVSAGHDVFYSTGPFLYFELKVVGKRYYSHDDKFYISFLAVKKEMICSSPFSDSKVHWPTGSSGTLFGPNYPNPYPHAIGMRSCTWVISVSTGNLVNLTFEHSLYEAFETNDSVEVRDGQSAHDKMIFKASVHANSFGNQFSVYSTGEYMRIKFNFFISGRVGNQVRGLRAHFKATPLYMRKTCLPGNKLNPQLALNGDQGTLKSPMKYYPTNLYCKWLISVPEGKVVKLTFERIIIDCGCRTDPKCLGPCECDFVQVQWVARNYTMVRRKYCGYLGEAKRQYNYLPDAIVSRYGNMTVIFSSDSDEGPDYSGFEASFKAVDPSNGKTRNIAIGVSVGAVVLIALVISIVCFVRRRKALALSYQLTTVNARNTSSLTTTTTRNDARNTRSAATPLTRANAGNTGSVTAIETRNNARDASLTATRAISTTSHGTQTSPPSPQATGQHSVNRSPSMNSVSLQTIPSGPPPAYPGSPDSPPPYPGMVEVPQYPPPGQSYPWDQRP